MSSNIWTPPAVASEASNGSLRLWRAVEAQHTASTMRLVATLEEQALLEQILESSKPALPPGAAGLHYLLATPFRYTSPIGSRFRAAADCGVWYGALEQRTACAELGFWRWKFLLDSPSLSELGPTPQTLFRAGIDACWVDLTAPPFERARLQWMHPTDYSATQRFARVARDAHMDAIRYRSVRDPRHGDAIAVLNPACFKPRKPLAQQIGFLTVRRERVIWQGGDTFEFDALAWKARPRT